MSQVTLLLCYFVTLLLFYFVTNQFLIEKFVIKLLLDDKKFPCSQPWWQQLVAATQAQAKRKELLQSSSTKDCYRIVRLNKWDLGKDC